MFNVMHLQVHHYNCCCFCQQGHIDAQQIELASLASSAGRITFSNITFDKLVYGKPSRNVTTFLRYEKQRFVETTVLVG